MTSITEDDRTGDGAGESDGRDELPEGPRLPSLVQAVMSLGLPFAWFPALRRRYGREFTMRFAPMHRAVVSLTRPDDIRDVFRGKPDTFHAGKGNLVLKPLLGEHSLLTQDGDEHARARRLLMPAFGRREIAGYRDLVRDVTARELENWPDGGPVRAHVLMNDLTLEVILRVVFGVTDTDRLDRIRPLVKSTVEIGPVMAVGASIPALRGVWPWRRFYSDREVLCGLLAEEIDSTRRADDLDERTDLLARLVRTEDGDGEVLSDDELIDQLLTLVMAGHETTATAISWTLLELAHNPDIQQRCLTAIRDEPDGGREYLDAVLKEALRRHSVVSIVMRELQSPVVVAGRRYGEGVTLSPAILLAHMDPRNYPEPRRFSPERFLGETPSPNSWLPFGGGARRCIGASFAQMEGEEILRQILSKYELSPRSRWVEPPRSRNVTSYPAFRARLRLRPRSAPVPE